MPRKKPVLGILSILRTHTDLPFGGQTEPFAELISVARQKNCLAYVFTLGDLDWNNKHILGYIPSEQEGNSWVQRPVPWPSIIYNRLPNRRAEQKEDYQENLSKIKQIYGSKFFNPFFLNKWSIYEILSENKDTSLWLPATRKFSSSALKNLLNTFGSVYLKPLDNSLGIGIRKLDIHFDTVFCRRLAKTPHIFDISHFPTAEFLEAFEHRHYLIQQSIKLTTYKDQPFDLRVLYQKDKNGNWKKTGAAARVAGEGSITTHVRYGGTRAPAYPLLKTIFGNKKFLNIKNEVERIGDKVPKAIELAYDSYFGELEMDIGIDQKGKPWIFEVNSKPFKFDEPLIRGKSLVRLMDYITYLHYNKDPNQKRRR